MTLAANDPCTTGKFARPDDFEAGVAVCSMKGCINVYVEVMRVRGVIEWVRGRWGLVRTQNKSSVVVDVKLDSRFVEDEGRKALPCPVFLEA